MCCQYDFLCNPENANSLHTFALSFHYRSIESHVSPIHILQWKSEAFRHNHVEYLLSTARVNCHCILFLLKGLWLWQRMIIPLCAKHRGCCVLPFRVQKSTADDSKVHDLCRTDKVCLWPHSFHTLYFMRQCSAAKVKWVHQASRWSLCRETETARYI